MRGCYRFLAASVTPAPLALCSTTVWAQLVGTAPTELPFSSVAADMNFAISIKMAKSDPLPGLRPFYVAHSSVV